MELRVGDKVKVVDNGECYTTYTKFFSENNINPEIAARYMYGKSASKSGYYRVLAKHEHRSKVDTVCVIEDITSRVFLISEKGIEKL